MKISTKSLLIGVLAVCAGLVGSGAEALCYEQCTGVRPGCYECRPAGQFTGLGCWNPAPCQCEEFYPYCAAPTDPPILEASLEDLGISPANEPAVCSAEAETATAGGE